MSDQKPDRRVKSGLNQAVRANLALGKDMRPWTEIAQEHGVKVTTVYRRVTEQRNRDKNERILLKRSNLGLPFLPTNSPKNHTSKVNFEQLLEEAASSPSMTREERMQALTVLAKNAPDAVKVAAIAKLEEFEKASGAQFGPPPPTNDEEVIQYLCDLFDGLPQHLILEALNRVNTPKTTEIAETVEDSPGDGDLGGREA